MNKVMNGDKLAAAMERFRTGIEALFAGGRVEEFLRFAASFHHYSFSNTLLIFIQRPAATCVAGLRKWNEMGRWVRKGEKGIAILAPVLVKKKFTVIDETTNTEREEEREVLVGFKWVYVFDVAQTEGKPLPRLVEHVTGESHADLFDRLAAASPVPVRLGDTGAANGYFDKLRNEIVVSPHLPGNMRIKTLLHEIAHAVAHGRDGEYRDDAYSMGEVVAEGAAFLAAAQLGLDTAEYSLGYVASWGKDLKAILAAGEKMMRVARQIIERVEKTLVRQQVA